MFFKKAKNKILKEWNFGYGDPELFSSSLESIEQIAKEDPKELQNLINLFESMPENTANEISDKLDLSDILVNLGYAQIKDFFIKIINHPLEEPSGQEYSYEWTNRDNKIWAAGNLIKLNDTRGENFLKLFIQQASKSEKKWIIEVLTDANNKMSLQLLLDLADQHEDINKDIDRPAVEKMLESATS